MLDSLSWKQFMEWFDYAQVEPFGEERADLRAGIVASVIANTNRDSKSKPEPYKPQDFMPDFAQDRVEKSKPLTSVSAWEQVKRTAKSLAMEQQAEHDAAQARKTASQRKREQRAAARQREKERVLGLAHSP